jgi:hypothetical protein
MRLVVERSEKIIEAISFLIGFFETAKNIRKTSVA